MKIVQNSWTGQIRKRIIKPGFVNQIKWFIENICLKRMFYSQIGHLSYLS